ncbi:MAG: phosphodiester glycosidase family protein [Verrucomicrobiaceae bacterium]|nr:phosphodiester glycosidase family protein [Verrucomicrobiaceae bacterium]
MAPLFGQRGVGTANTIPPQASTDGMFPSGPAPAPLYPAYPTQLQTQQAELNPTAGTRWHLVSRSKERALSGGARYQEVRVQSEGGLVDISYVVFDSRSHTLRVIDQAAAQAGGNIIGAAMLYHGAVAGVNGGFFSKAFQPVGLMVTGGQTLGSFAEKSSLITGMVAVAGGEPYLLWNAEYEVGAGFSDALQAGPRLVSSSVAVGGLSGKRSCPRTFVATDGGRLWVLGVARTCSLAALAEILTTPQVFEMKVMRALNLDGGHSSALWAGPTSGEEISQPGWSTVRNYLGVVPKK